VNPQTCQKTIPRLLTLQQQEQGYSSDKESSWGILSKSFLTEASMTSPSPSFQFWVTSAIESVLTTGCCNWGKSEGPCGVSVEGGRGPFSIYGGLPCTPGDFPGGSVGKASVCNAGDLGSVPGSGRFPGEGNGNPLQYSYLENPMDGGTWYRLLPVGLQRVGHDCATSFISFYYTNRSLENCLKFNFKPNNQAQHHELLIWWGDNGKWGLTDLAVFAPLMK